ncbi:MAG: hypothetical protein IPL32_10905 [Chloracidobacterium sp.]|nr:hypothetical protein [Chloracidobacterium sp.]
MKRIRLCTICFVVLPAVFSAGCGANEGVLRSGNETPIQVVEDKPSFEKDLNAMHTAGFTSIYVLRRRDGKTIDAEDVRVIKELTVDTNRRVKSDSDKAVLIGSNFEMPKESLSELNARFLVEDRSAPPVNDANTNLNSNK